MADFNLDRFVEAQDPVQGRVWDELREGYKRSHWMWFVFPQVSGLGRSEMAVRYAIRSLSEAKAYLTHPILGDRLRQATQMVLDTDNSAHNIFGDPDDMKFRSSMTLFLRAGGGPLFQAALDKFFKGDVDEATDEILKGDAKSALIAKKAGQ